MFVCPNFKDRKNNYGEYVAPHPSFSISCSCLILFSRLVHRVKMFFMENAPEHYDHMRKFAHKCNEQ